MFTGNEDQAITLQEASELTANYRNAHPGQTLGGYFGRKILTDLLAQPNCVGVRVYYANKADGSDQLVVVGVDANENDLFEGLIGDKSFLSPPYKGSVNSLNS
ncbi:MAG: hypothetical protein IT236_09425 [Bacteroidia bacterium]|nr:hypothetical protein [Bacteroidia bacterium]